MIEIEFPKPQTSICECCGGATTRLTRFVHEDGDAFAIYYAAFSDEHQESGVTGIISLGDWDEDSIPESRVAFAFRLWEGEETFNVTIFDASESQWSDAKVLGRKLSREEALAHPRITDVYHITDHMTEEDPDIQAFFTKETLH
jgi:hypothetical protein